MFRTPDVVQPQGAEWVQWRSSVDNGLRRFGFYFALMLIFFRFSTLHEALSILVGHPLYLLYVVGPPALIALVVTGGIPRTLKSRAALCWIGFLACLIVDIPFSSWPGGSLQFVYTYLKTEFPMLLVIGGLVLTWSECRAVFVSIGLGTLGLLFTSRLLVKDDNSGRVSLDAGTIANANDLAAHLVLVTPFLLYVALSRRNALTRTIAAAGVAYSVYQILSTASRGALIALVVMSLVLFVRASSAVRVATIVLVPVLGLAIFSILPRETTHRILSFSDSGSSDSEAIASTEQRTYLLQQSLLFSLYHPLFGVGPGQFSTEEGFTSRLRGERGAWHETHNTYTQISAECGATAFVLAFSGMVLTFMMASRTYNRVRRDPRLKDIATASLCLVLSLTGFYTVIIFLSDAYRFYLPALCGLAIALSRAVDHEIEALRLTDAAQADTGARERANVPAWQRKVGGAALPASAKRSRRIPRPTH
jgi:hypothetical protein